MSRAGAPGARARSPTAQFTSRNITHHNSQQTMPSICRQLSLLQRTASPALVVDMDAVRANIAVVLGLAGGDASRWRPHLKTTKIPAVWQLLLDAGVRKFKVATPRELEHLGRLAAARSVRLDALVAFPHVGPTLSATATVARRHADSLRVGMLVEDPEGARELPPELPVRSAARSPQRCRLAPERGTLPAAAPRPRC